MSAVSKFYGTAAVLAARNPLVPAGGVAAESDTGIVKVGDGHTRYNSLSTALNSTYATIANGINPDYAGYDLIVIAGQSNAVGNDATVDSKLDSTDGRIWQYGNSGTYANQISLAADPLAHHAAVGVGPGMAFARRYLQHVPTNRKVLLVPVGHGGTPFEGLTASSLDINWRVGGSGTSLYQNAIDQTTAALAAAGANARVVAFIWVQGEQDVANSTSAATYRTDLDALIDGWRAAISGAANASFVIGQMVPEVIAANPSTYGAIDTVHIDTIRRKTLTGFAYGPTGAYQASSNVHYTAAGQRTQGLNLFNAYRRALLNVTGTAAAVPTGLSVTQSGTTITATWDLPSGRVTNYDVQYSSNGGSSYTTVSRTNPSPAATQAITGLTLGATYLVKVRATNEDGTSAYCTAASFTLASLPTQVTGVSLTPVAGGMTITWSAVTGATSYLMEYKQHSSGTWLTGSTVTGTTSSLSGLAAGTSYDVRVTASNAAGSGTTSSTATASTPTITTLGVTSSAPSQAYSAARKIVSSYSGYAMRVFRSVDGATLDVGFDGSGNLDTTSLLAFVGVADGLVTTLYDQSGNSRDVTQSSQAAMPKIVSSGSLQTAGGKPAIVFDGSATFLSRNQGSFLSTGIYNAGAMTLCAVMLGASQATKHFIAEGQSGGANGVYSVVESAAANGYLIRFLRGNSGTISLAADAGATPAFLTGAIHQLSVVDTGAAFTRYVDVTQTVTESYTRSQDPLTDRFAIGGYIKSGVINSPMAANFCEAVIWGSALNSTDRGTAQTDQKTFYGTP